MSWAKISWMFVVVLAYLPAAHAVLCFNCTATQNSINRCAGLFAQPYLPFNGTQMDITTCTGEYAMCFVRAWTARSKHAWIVQRGCYQSSKDDPLPASLSIPTRSMTCNNQRLAEAEFRVCLCQGNYCNNAPSLFPLTSQNSALILLPFMYNL